MSAGTIEATFLEGIALDEAPPCQFSRWALGPDGLVLKMCGAPSVVRLVITCGKCGFKVAQFSCQYDYDILRRGRSKCCQCAAPITEWKEI